MLALKADAELSSDEASEVIDDEIGDDLAWAADLAASYCRSLAEAAWRGDNSTLLRVHAALAIRALSEAAHLIAALGGAPI